MTGGTYLPDVHPLTAEQAARYGRVFCANVANQILVGRSPDRAQMRFIVNDRDLEVYRDGEFIARVKHDLTDATINALAEGTVSYAQGLYGPFRGEVTVHPD